MWTPWSGYVGLSGGREGNKVTDMPCPLHPNTNVFMKTNDLRELRHRFPSLKFDTENDLPRARFMNDGAGVEFFLHGAHVSRFDASDGGSPIFISSASAFENGKAIRGGVPLCFPWFGPKKDEINAPQHGFARTADWELTEVSEKDVTLALRSTPQTLQVWPHEFLVNYRIGIDCEHLRLAFEVQNTGTAAFDFEIALHTYFRVADARGVSIDGLNGKTYLDKVDDLARKTQKGAAVFEKETDRVYVDSSGPIVLRDGERTVRIRDMSGWRSTIVWNPWIEKTRQMKDMADDEWTQFVCIESGAVGEDIVTLGAGESYTLAIEIEVKS
jgi:glucose-6-phosphate 1-epimerase